MVNNRLKFASNGPRSRRACGPSRARKHEDRMVTDLSPPKPPPRAPETTAAPAFWPQKAGWVLADRQVLRGRMVSKEFGVVDGDHRGRFDLLGTTLPLRPAGPAPFSSRALWRYFWVRVVRNPARPWRLSRRDAPVTRGRPALGRL